jgi:hypothetical protein
MFLLGAVGAALCLTKINVGAFYLAALAYALVCVLPSSRLRSAAIAVLLAYAVLAPPLLAHSRLSTGSAGFCLVAILSTAATFAWGALAKPDSPLGLRRAWLAVAGLVLGTTLLVLGALCQGVSLPALVDGVILEPARHPSGLLFLGFRLGVLPCAATVLALAAISCLFWLRPRLAPYRFWLGALRCGVGLAAVFLLVRTDLSWVVPFLPLGVFPLTAREWRLAEWFPRLFIAGLAATQFLQTYPVAGSQVGIASVPVLLWAFVCLSDGVEELSPLPRWPSCALWKGAAGALVALVVSAGMWLSGTRAAFPYPASRLPGAAGLHLPPQQAEDYRFLAGTIAANCSVLFTLPRMGSFNLWSGVPAPPGSEAPISLQVFTGDLQKSVLDRLRSDPRACVLYNRDLLEFWQATPRDVSRLPLVHYILDEMPQAAEKDGYQIRVNPHRNVPWTEKRKLFP